MNPFDLKSNLQRLAARGRFVACSNYIADRLVEAGVPRGRVLVAHPSPPGSALQTRPPPREPRLLFVGQLLRGKGVAHAIEALRWLPRVTLTVVGDGPSRRELEEQAHRVAPGRVRFEGFLPGEQVDRCYDEASVVLVPSHWPEPFGMTGIEAMRRARPVVGAAHGGIPEWLPEGTAGYLFRPGDPRSLALAVQRALGDASLGERARAFVQRAFPHERYLLQLEEALAACLPGPPAASAVTSLLHGRAGEEAHGPTEILRRPRRQTYPARP